MGPNSLVSDVGKGPRMRKPHLSMCRPPQVIAQGREIVALRWSRVHDATSANDEPFCLRDLIMRKR